VDAIIKGGREIALKVAVAEAGGGREGKRDINPTSNKRASLLAACSLLLISRLAASASIISRLLTLL
jgi:hypothetical protein